MIILGIVGSPRKQGNTYDMMNWALNKAGEKDDIETELIELCDHTINDCLACATCKGNCVQNDEMNNITCMMTAADGIIFGAPVYFGTIPALMKRFFDRTRILRHNDFSLADKPVGFISVAARRNGGQETTIMDMIKIMLRHNCIITGNGNFTGQYGGTGWAAGKNTVETDRFGKETCEGVGERVAYLADAMACAYEHTGQVLTFDPKSGTPEAEL